MPSSEARYLSRIDSSSYHENSWVRTPGILPSSWRQTGVRAQGSAADTRGRRTTSSSSRGRTRLQKPRKNMARGGLESDSIHSQPTSQPTEGPISSVPGRCVSDNLDFAQGVGAEWSVCKCVCAWFGEGGGKKTRTRQSLKCRDTAENVSPSQA